MKIINYVVFFLLIFHRLVVVCLLMCVCVHGRSLEWRWFLTFLKNCFYGFFFIHFGAKQWTHSFDGRVQRSLLTIFNSCAMECEIIIYFFRNHLFMLFRVFFLQCSLLLLSVIKLYRMENHFIFRSIWGC